MGRSQRTQNIRVTCAASAQRLRTLVRRGTGVVRFLLFLVGWPGVVLMFAFFETITSAPYFIYACVPTSGHTVLARSRFSVGPLSKTLARYWTATGSVY